MKMWLNKNCGKPFLSSAFSSLMLAIIFCGLAQVAKIAPRASFSEPLRETGHHKLLDYQPGASVCDPTQTPNLVPNPDFEQGIGQLNFWVDDGKCTFSDDNPGHGSATSAEISTESTTEKRCVLFTPIDMISVEPGKFYDYSAWIKANLEEGNAYLAITFWRLHGTWRPIGDPALTVSVTNTEGDWIQVTGSVQAPADAEYARVETILAESSRGSVWFDDTFLGLSTCLDISKRDDPHQVVPGQILTYTIVYSNTGREAATNIQIIETYDKDVDLNLELTQPHPDISNNIWQVDELSAGDSGMITAVVQVEDEVTERNWLFNTVGIFSNETLNQIITTTRTSIDIPTGTCGVYLDLAKESGSGQPGQVVNYGLELRNAGDYDGQATLTAISSLNWDFEFDPPTCALPIDSSKPVTLSLSVPLDAPDSAYDTTLISATLACGSPGDKEDVAFETVNTSVVRPVFLPVVMKDFLDKSSWEVEPNDSCDQASGPVYPGREYYGYPNDLRDVFSVDLYARGMLNVDLTIHTDEGVQLQLRDQRCELIDQLYVYHAPYHIEYTGDEGRYYICIYTEPEHQDVDRPYTLRVEFP
jgi:uncharacterized repeat protein (TIGR01451 family)